MLIQAGPGIVKHIEGQNELAQQLEDTTFQIEQLDENYAKIAYQYLNQDSLKNEREIAVADSGIVHIEIAGEEFGVSIHGEESGHLHIHKNGKEYHLNIAKGSLTGGLFGIMPWIKKQTLDGKMEEFFDDGQSIERIRRLEKDSLGNLVINADFESETESGKYIIINKTITLPSEIASLLIRPEVFEEQLDEDFEDGFKTEKRGNGDIKLTVNFQTIPQDTIDLMVDSVNQAIKEPFEKDKMSHIKEVSIIYSLSETHQHDK